MQDLQPYTPSVEAFIPDYPVPPEDRSILPPEWQIDLSHDKFDVIKRKGSFILRDFDVDNDAIDLSAFDFTYDQLCTYMRPKKHHTMIDLSTIQGATWRCKIILKFVSHEELDESNFIL